MPALPPSGRGIWTAHARIDPIDEARCRVHLSAETPQMAALLLTALDADFAVESPSEVAAALRDLAARFTRAAG